MPMLKIKIYIQYFLFQNKLKSAVLVYMRQNTHFLYIFKKIAVPNCKR